MGVITLPAYQTPQTFLIAVHGDRGETIDSALVRAATELTPQTGGTTRFSQDGLTGATARTAPRCVALALIPGTATTERRLQSGGHPASRDAVCVHLHLVGRHRGRRRQGALADSSDCRSAAARHLRHRHQCVRLARRKCPGDSEPRSRDSAHLWDDERNRNRSNHGHHDHERDGRVRAGAGYRRLPDRLRPARGVGNAAPDRVQRRGQRRSDAVGAAAATCVARWSGVGRGRNSGGECQHTRSASRSAWSRRWRP